MLFESFLKSFFNS